MGSENHLIDTLCRKKRLSLYNLNNLAKNEPTSKIFGAQNPEEISHQKISNSPTSPK